MAAAVMGDIRATSLLANGSVGTAASYTTAPATPAPNRLELLAVANTNATTPGIPTVTGCGLTWVQIGTSVWDTGAPQRRVTMFRALGSGASTGALTIDFAGVSQTSCTWLLTEYTNVDTTGTNGSGAVIQAVLGTPATTSAYTITLAGFGNVNNATAGFFAHSTAEATAPGAGFALAGQFAANSMVTASTFRDDNNVTVGASWGTSSPTVVLGLEIKQTLTPVGGATHLHLPLLGVG